MVMDYQQDSRVVWGNASECKFICSCFSTYIHKNYNIIVVPRWKGLVHFCKLKQYGKLVETFINVKRVI